MSVLTQRDLQKFATAVTDDFMGQNIPLNESISKLAGARALNEDQIGRVCEAANNLTFNKMFTSTEKTAADRIIEFEVADRKKVMGNLIKNASAELDTPPLEKTAMRELRPLADDRYYSRQGLAEPTNTKVANFELRPAPKSKREQDTRTIRKTIDHLRHEKLAHDTAYTEAVVVIRDTFRRAYNDLPFAAFEKQAAALWTDEASVVLAELRTQMRLPAVTYNYDGLQKRAGYVNDTHPTMRLLKAAMDLNDTRDRISRAVTKLEASL